MHILSPGGPVGEFDNGEKMKFYTETILNRIVSIVKALTTVDSPKVFIGTVIGLLAANSESLSSILPAVIVQPQTVAPTRKGTDKWDQEYHVAVFHVKKYDPSGDYHQTMLAKTSLIAQAIFNSGCLGLTGTDKRLVWETHRGVKLVTGCSIRYRTEEEAVLLEHDLDILVHAIDFTIAAESDL